jgi:hypothetical protein
MSRVNLARQVKTDDGWKRVVLERNSRGRARWGSGKGRYLMEGREGGRRVRAAARANPAEALEAQRRKRLELGAKENNLELLGLPNLEDNILLDRALQNFQRDITAFRKPLTLQKYEYVVGLFFERGTLKKFAREITPEGIKDFLFCRKSQGFDPGTTLCTGRIILHNFLSTLKIDNPVKEVPRHRCPSGAFPGYGSSEVLK